MGICGSLLGNGKSLKNGEGKIKAIKNESLIHYHCMKVDEIETLLCMQSEICRDFYLILKYIHTVILLLLILIPMILTTQQKYDDEKTKDWCKSY